MSCLGFGELNIPSSRAFWDDCDEDEIPEESAVEKEELRCDSGDVIQPFTSELMLLIEGLNIAEFAEAILINDGVEKICDIPSKKSSLHRAPKKNILIGILDEDLMKSGEVLELLIPFAKEAKEIITITVKPKIDYKSENIAKIRDEITFIRGINSKVENVLELKAPNFITGVCAGIASWRDVMKLPVSSYVVYTDNIGMDSLAARPLLELLHGDLGIDVALKFKLKEKDNSHLYL